MSSKQYRVLARFVRQFTLGAAAFLGLAIGTAHADNFPGGFMEKPDTATIRARLSASQIQSFLPARGAFTFPAPYNTQGVRITNATDCGGGDCVWSVGYSYWRNMNNHVGSDTMYVFLGLKARRVARAGISAPPCRQKCT